MISGTVQPYGAVIEGDLPDICLGRFARQQSTTEAVRNGEKLAPERSTLTIVRVTRLKPTLTSRFIEAGHRTVSRLLRRRLVGSGELHADRSRLLQFQCDRFVWSPEIALANYFRSGLWRNHAGFGVLPVSIAVSKVNPFIQGCDG